MGERTKWCCVYSLGTHVTMYIFAPPVKRERMRDLWAGYAKQLIASD